MSDDTGGKEKRENPEGGEADEPLYTIGVVSRLLNCDPHTLRRYEKAGLVKPSRTEGNTRLYSNRHVERLREVHHLIEHEKLNAKGADMVLRLKEEIDRLQQEIAELRRKLDQFSGYPPAGKPS